MKFHFLLTLLCLNIAFSARAELIQNANSAFKDPNSALKDLDENFIQDSYQSQFTWRPEQQSVRNEIEKTLVLAPSLIRSFVLVADKDLNPKPQLATIVPALDKEAFKKLSVQQKTFVHSSMAKGLTRNLEPGASRFLAEMELLGDFENHISKFAGHGTRDNRVQVLVSEPGGTGVTEMLETYGKIKGKNLLRVPFPVPGDEFNMDAFVTRIQDEAHPDSVLVLDHLERAPAELWHVLEVLLTYPALAGNMDIVLTIDSPDKLPKARRNQSPFETYGLQELQNLEPYIDSLHVVRLPQGPLYYEQIIRKNWQPALARIADKLDRHTPAPSVLEQSFVKKMAQAVYKQQQQDGISAIRKLHQIMYDPIYESCEEDLKRSRADRLIPSLRGIANDYALAVQKVMRQTP